jgi:hypothetical protein
MKGSQEYPKQFGHAVRNVILKNQDGIRTRRAYNKWASEDKPTGELSKDPWDDAELASVREFLLS